MSYLPTTDAGLRDFSANFSAKAEALVDPGTVGLTADQVTAYAAVTSDYAGKLLAAIDPATRGTATILAKNEAKVQLIALTRELGMAVANHPGITNEQRSAFGLTVRDNEPTPVPVPDASPVIEVSSVQGHRINFRLKNGDSTSRAKPTGVIGATLLSYVGEVPPVELSDWKFEGNVTRTILQLDMPAAVAPGSKVWLTAFWFNTKGQSGPATTPVSTWVGNGGVSQTTQLKIAA